jgi:hypothetical protein
MQPAASSSSAPTPYHAVRFYESDKSLARIVAEFLHEGFDHGSPGLVVATAAQRAAIIRELTARSVDVVELQAHMTFCYWTRRRPSPSRSSDVNRNADMASTTPLSSNGFVPTQPRTSMEGARSGRTPLPLRRRRAAQ